MKELDEMIEKLEKIKKLWDEVKGLPPYLPHPPNYPTYPDYDYQRCPIMEKYGYCFGACFNCPYGLKITYKGNDSYYQSGVLR
jgi:hypothetical protein